MRSTSIAAYKSIKPIVGERQRQVYNALEEISPASNRQISEQSHIPINVVSARMNELVSSGKVVEAYKDQDSKTGRLVMFWKPQITNAMLFEDIG